MYQHYTQRAYLEQWNTGGGLFVFDKAGDLGKPINKGSAKRIFGIEDWQSMELENAFSDVETVKGNVDHVGEITSPKMIAQLARWMALHVVRNGINAPTVASFDYRPEVDRLAALFELHHGFWQDFATDCLITGDSPVVRVANQRSPIEFIVAPANPRRCVYLMPGDIGFSHNGKPLFQPDQINRLVMNNAARYCVSFDPGLHLPAN